ncbi:MAG: hypothetical protein LC130_24680 [Bryobacterales bacterium]|nr:hypothetical protein [Bryobacterales bacterium]
MSEAKHKPGPWKWHRYKTDPDGPWFCSLESEAPIEDIPHRDRLVLAMREDCAQFPYAGTLPSDLLIEAAPELLEACKELLSWTPPTPPDYDTKGPDAFSPEMRWLIDRQNQARAAIAKAEGR